MRLGTLLLLRAFPTALSMALLQESRTSTLCSWKSSTNELGYAREERTTNENGDVIDWKVTLCWHDHADPVTLSMPCAKLLNVESSNDLSQSLWSAGLAGAILCQAPNFQLRLRNKRVLELGSGVGLLGLSAAMCASATLLTDHDQRAVERLCEFSQTSPLNIETKVLEWKDDDPVCEPVDCIVGSDIAYYWYLLRPLMDTMKRHQGPKCVNLIVGQANRESQWDLFKNIQTGCYNQLTDEQDPPWNGKTQLALFDLCVTEWTENGNGKMGGTVPIAAIVHESEPLPQPLFSANDYLASLADKETMMMSF